jgi:hypothetical protein
MADIHLFLFTNAASPEQITSRETADLMGTSKYIYLSQNSVSFLKFDFEKERFSTINTH